MNSLSIDKNEVLRYLGYKGMGIDDNTLVLIQECVNELQGLVKERYVYKNFRLNRLIDSITLDEYALTLSGKDIQKHLEESDECVLMAITLGSTVDKRIRYYSIKNLVKGLIFDACANTAVEEICDKVCKEIDDSLKKVGKKITNRYSPGYGDLPLDIQKQIIFSLEADKSIGLTASSNNILLPQKSVTAIVGIIDMDKIVKEINCSSCSMYKSCNFRKEGKTCGS